jgi:uncharacterized protein YdeI (YjbR/CyaY-like superfamily)
MSAPTYFKDPSAFRRWLARHAASADELIVGFHKVDSGRPSMTWSESVDEALCFGWIDGVRKRIDEHSYQIRFTRRKPTSIWSAVNIAKVEALQAQGRMTAAGEAAYAHRNEAKSVVYAYEQTQEATLTPDEVRQFQANGSAWQYWHSAPPGYRKLVLHRITTAKRPATRAARLTHLIDLSARGERWT